MHDCTGVVLPMSGRRDGIFYYLHHRPYGDDAFGAARERGAMGWYWAVVRREVVRGRRVSERTVWRGDSEEEAMDRIADLRRKAIAHAR